MNLVAGGCFFVLILMVSKTNATNSNVMVRIFNGLLKGETRINQLTGMEYLAYHAIPYAKPPINELRFLPPEPYTEMWSDSDPYDASDSLNTPICPQLAEGNFMHLTKDEFNEDCLYLSVYTPPKCTNQTILPLLPVLVWIHGGSFDRGTGMFPYHGPERIIQGNDIIMVSINYRVGILGFLSLGNQEVPGNMGLEDQAMAFRWVQKNIHAFGGNPGMVTLMGESAGSWSAFYHLFSPASTGLFRRIIAQSGTPMSTAYHEYSGEVAAR